MVDVLDAIVERGAPVAANNSLSAIRKFFNWCFERGVIVSNPCNGIKKPAKAESRDRVLTEDELRSIWRASDMIGYPFGALVQLLLLTAQRRTEVTTMRWRDIDLPSGAWTIPAELTKNGKSHLVPLSAFALTRIASLPRLQEPSSFRRAATTRRPSPDFRN